MRFRHRQGVAARRRPVGLLCLTFLAQLWGSSLSILAAPPAAATDLFATLQSPAFGGADSAALSAAQTGQSLKVQAAAVKAALQKPPTPPVDPNAAFISAITSQLTGLVAETIAQKIANSKNGQAGTIKSDGVIITYVNSDGELSITITTPTSTTTLTIPTVGGN
jgi:hypothetical protein